MWDHIVFFVLRCDRVVSSCQESFTRLPSPTCSISGIGSILVHGLHTSFLWIELWQVSTLIVLRTGKVFDDFVAEHIWVILGLAVGANLAADLAYLESWFSILSLWYRNVVFYLVGQGSGMRRCILIVFAACDVAEIDFVQLFPLLCICCVNLLLEAIFLLLELYWPH